MLADKIAMALVTAHRSVERWRCIRPVHGSRTGRSLTLPERDGDPGLVVHCHAGCNRQDISPSCAACGCSPAAVVVLDWFPMGARGDQRTDTARRIAKDDRSSCYEDRQ